MSRITFAYVPSSHLDLYWLGSYRTCLERGAEVIRAYLDRCLASDDETFLLETVVFAEYFLDRHPGYREQLLRLIQERRVEIGAAFVDRWEHLILGESHVRNIQIGAAWCEAFIGRPNPLATHPDLPGLAAQTVQIYTQAGVKHYVTSRKAFEDGAVWRHRAPDGTELLFLNWPKHYIYCPLDIEDLPTPFTWIRSGIDAGASARMFPLGVIPVNGGAGDLTSPEDVERRYGATLQQLIQSNRETYPEFDFAYTVPGAVLEPYAEVDGLPVLQGEIPSVWGVACDEEVTFFQRNRESEYRLLAAETMAVVLEHLTLQPLPSPAEPWQGRFHESAFYARKDPMPAGREFNELWKMHLFSADHNGGGYEGALSTFQKRVMQERVLAYTAEAFDHGLDTIAANLAATGTGALAFNPLSAPWSGALAIDVPMPVWSAGLRPVDNQGNSLPVQIPTVNGDGNDIVRVAVAVEEIPSVGYRFIRFESVEGANSPAPAEVGIDDAILTVANGGVEIAVDRSTGDIIHLRNLGSGTDWGRIGLGAIRAIPEVGNDVTLRIDPDAKAISSEFVTVDIAGEGPLFTSIRIERRILGAPVEQTIALWHDGHVEFETRLRWWGAHNWQLRMALPTAGTLDDIAYGSPFYGSAWSDVPVEAAPRNRDEILVEDYIRYREVQEWLHLRDGDAGLLLVTTHPGFCHVDNGLEAVLLRTSPSCGDTRYFWENAGEQVYRFSLYPAGPDWKSEGAIALAQRRLRPPATRFQKSTGGGSLPDSQSFLAVESPSAVLSSVSSNVETGAVDIRVFEAQGIESSISLAGPLVERHGTKTELVDLRGHPAAEPDHASRDLPAWRIQTYRVMQNSGNTQSG